MHNEIVTAGDELVQQIESHISRICMEISSVPK